MARGRREPDDVGTRAVLGDALVESGDLRGDMIVLQCNARAPGRPLRTHYDGRVKRHPLVKLVSSG